MEDSNPSASAGQSADLDFLNRGVLLMRLGRLLAPLVLSAAALALFLRGSLSAALFVLAAAAAGSAGALPIEQLAAARTGISRRTLLALEFRVYFGSNRTNALFLSPFLRCSCLRRLPDGAGCRMECSGSAAPPRHLRRAVSRAAAAGSCPPAAG